MKNILLSMMALFCVNTYASDDKVTPGFPTTVEIAINHVYVPVGFDSNDNSQVVIEGVLSNSCLKLNEPTFTVDGENISVTQTAFFDRTSMCIALEVPFYKTVNIGRLPVGNYYVTVSAGLETVKTLRVERPGSDRVDNHLYAPVQDAYVQGHTLLMKGEFPDTGYEVEKIDIQIYGDTIVVLPIMKRFQGITQPRQTPFEVTVDLSRYVGWNRSYLIHIRASNGTSVNLVEHFLQ